MTIIRNLDALSRRGLLRAAAGSAALIPVGFGASRVFAGGSLPMPLSERNAAQFEGVTDVPHVQRRPGGHRFGGTKRRVHHWTRPFCHASSLSRTRNNNVISPVHINAITSSAESGTFRTWH
jgi:hypothetical protein